MQESPTMKYFCVLDIHDPSKHISFASISIIKNIYLSFVYKICRLIYSLFTFENYISITTVIIEIKNNSSIVTIHELPVFN